MLTQWDRHFQHRLQHFAEENGFMLAREIFNGRNMDKEEKEIKWTFNESSTI